MNKCDCKYKDETGCVTFIAILILVFGAMNMAWLTKEVHRIETHLGMQTDEEVKNDPAR